jgi:drug/metabolite transporter (DMT)-like permease
VLVPTVGYAVGPLIVSRRLDDLEGIGVITVSLAIASVLYGPYALTHLPSTVSLEVVGAVAGLALVCTALAFVLFFELIVEVGPARSTVITYVNPAVAVLLGVLVLHEPLTWGIVVGFPLILMGSWLATAPRQGAHSPLAAEPPSG